MPRILDRKSLDKRVAAYNSDLMARWTRGRVDVSRQRWRNSNGRERGPGGIARERITRSLPVAPARASASGRAAHCPSCFSRQRDRLILLRPSSLLASAPGGWMAWSLAFLTPFFIGDLPHLSPSLSLSPSCPRTPSTIRCRTSLQRNFAQWRNLAITIACPYSPVIPYRLYFSLNGVAPQHRSQPSLSRAPFSSAARVALCIPLLPDKWRVLRTVRRTGLVYIYNTGWRGG